MSIITAVLKDFLAVFNIHTNKGRIYIATLLAVLLGGYFFISSQTSVEEGSAAALRAVTVAEVGSFTDSALIQLVGTVSSVDQAVIQTEVSGRVTSVPVTLGQTVRAGQIIAQLESASEYASLLQAEGAYEGALVAAQSSNISLSEAENNLTSANNTAINIYRNAYQTGSNALYNTLDDFFGNPDYTTPGVKVADGANARYLNEERSAFRAILRNWQEKSASLSANTIVPADLEEAQGYVTRLIVMNNTFIQEIEDADKNELLNDQTLATYAVTLNTLQGTLNTTLASLESAVVTIQNAEEALSRAQLGSTNTELSSANAQVKQALGSLRAAQAQYEKTILRTPIAGVVNVLDVKVGGFVNSSQRIAEVANNDALEVTTFVGESDREYIKIGQEVKLGQTETGVISNIAPVVNPATGKIEVKIQSTSKNLLNGDTVVIRVLNVDEKNEDVVEATLSVPLTAVKFTADAGSVYTVEDGVIQEHPITIGNVRDEYIEVLSGITSDMQIILDARGLSAGESVTVITK